MQAANPLGSHESSWMTDPEESEHVQEEFEAAVAEIDSLESQKAAEAVLKRLPGVFASAVIRGAIWVSFDPAILRRERICERLHEAGFSPEISLLNGKPVRC